MNLNDAYEAMQAANYKARRAFENYLNLQTDIARADYRRNEAELQALLDAAVDKMTNG